MHPGVSIVAGVIPCHGGFRAFRFNHSHDFGIDLSVRVNFLLTAMMAFVAFIADCHYKTTLL